MSAPCLSRAQFLRGAFGLTTAAVGSGQLAPALARAEVASVPAAEATRSEPLMVGDLDFALDIGELSTQGVVRTESFTFDSDGRAKT